MWSLHVLPMYKWVLCGYSDFLPLSKDMHVRLTGDSKFTLGVSARVHGCLFQRDPAMNLQTVQVVP